MTSCEIIAVGTEILLGEIVDTNSAEIARTVRSLGLEVRRVTAVGDDVECIRAAVAEAVERSDCVIVTGGLGPTVDDPTRQAVAAAAGAELEFQPELWAETEAMIHRFGREPTANNRLQALIPAGSRPIHNPVGTAPGFWLRIGPCLVLALPGVPHEMRRMLAQAVVPLVVTLLGASGATVVRVLHTAGLAESEVDERIADLERGRNPSVGLAASPGRIDVRITARAASREAATEIAAGVEAEIRARLGRVVYGTDEDTLAGAAADLLVGRGWSIAAIECGLGGTLLRSLALSNEALRRAHLVRDLTGHGLQASVQALRTDGDADVGVGALLQRERAGWRARVVVASPLGTAGLSRALAGPEDVAAERAAVLAMDCLRRHLEDAGASDQG